METEISAEIFLKYHFTETKDLLKAFITLISATLVLSIAFAEKIVDFKNSELLAKGSLVFCWILLVSAVVLAGVSVCSIALPGGAAMYGNPKSISQSVLSWAGLANGFALLAGAAFVGGLMFMVVAAAVSMRNRQAKANSANDSPARNVG